MISVFVIALLIYEIFSLGMLNLCIVVEDLENKHKFCITVVFLF